MPVDPQVQAILNEIGGAADDLDYEALPVELIRQGFDATNAPPPPQDVARVSEHSVPGLGGEISVRIYTPQSPEGGALVYLHGGGWASGSLETHDSLCRALANAAACVVASVDYRLVPEHKFPAAPEDCFAAVRWVADQASELGIDASRIAVAGDSAGGNLAAVTAQLCRDRGGPSLCHQVLIYPITDHTFDTPSYRENASGYLLTRNLMRWFWKQYLNDPAEADEPMASPIRAKSLEGLAPATVITAEYDPLRDEGEAYAESLRKAGVPTQLLRFDGQIHGFLVWGAKIDRAGDGIREIAEALRRAFGTSTL